MKEEISYTYDSNIKEEEDRQNMVARKAPFCGGGKKRVDGKVAPFMELTVPMERSRREDKENGLIFSDPCTWRPKPHREWDGWWWVTREKEEETVLSERREVMHINLFFSYLFVPSLVHIGHIY